MTTRLTYRANGDANSYALLDDTGNWFMSLMLNGQQMTATQEENLRRLAACWNVCQGFDTEVLESILLVGETMLTRFQARDRIEQTVIADRLKAMQERDALRATAVQLRSALRDYEGFRESLFAQCCSNPVFDSWGRQVDMTALNDAHQAADRALKAAGHITATPCTGGDPQCKWVPDGHGSKCTTCGDTVPF